MPTNLPRRKADKPSIGTLMATFAELRLARVRLQLARFAAALRGRPGADDKGAPR